MHELKFTLQQHTPLIHFQADQEGATLRASEVKPKLDKFIVDKYGGVEELRKIHPNWFISDKQYVLKYQMRIVGKGNHKPFNISYQITKEGKFKPDFPNVFGNVEMEDEQKKGVIYDTTEVIIFCLFQGLKKEIEEHFSGFISQANFGYRQSKGFGCFSVLNENIKGASAFFKLNISQQNDYKGVFERIELFYKSIRGGVRQYGDRGICLFYFKSLIVAYYKSKKEKLDWDKAAIKNARTSNHDVHGIDIKDLLGFSTDERWEAKYRMSIFKQDSRAEKIEKLEKQIKYAHNDYEKLKLKEELQLLHKKLVSRFASPVIFKPIYSYQEKCWRIFLVLKDIPKDYINSTILATSNKLRAELKLWEKFDLHEYIEFISKYNSEDEIENHIDLYYKDDDERPGLDSYLNHRFCSLLKGIYTNFKLLGNHAR